MYVGLYTNVLWINDTHEKNLQSNQKFKSVYSSTTGSVQSVQIITNLHNTK